MLDRFFHKPKHVMHKMKENSPLLVQEEDVHFPPTMAWYGKSTSDARVWMTINSSVARGISHTKLSVLFEVSTPM